MRPGRRGFLLVMCLLMACLVLVLGVGFLGSGGPRYNSAVQARVSTQAHFLALAGLEDARVKIQKDPLFPPAVPLDTTTQQSIYAYREDMTDMAGNLLGSYIVTVDQSFIRSPYWVLLVTSRGQAGAVPTLPEATSVIHAEFDMRPIDPATPHLRDANYARIVNWWEEAQ